MNKQGKIVNGKVVGGIEWTKTVRPDGTEYCGYTWNAISGCQHGCRWQMPDLKIAECYAENVAEGVAQSSYPNGFEHHYWNPDRLDEPLAHKEPVKIFGDSMSDWMGAWVPDEQIRAVLDVMKRAPQHTFQMLTKNAPRLLKFKGEFPPNLWVLASSPPDIFRGHTLTPHQKERMLERQLETLSALDNVITGMSIEPLSWDISQFLVKHWGALKWAILGAASNGRTHYQPNSQHLVKVLDALDAQRVPVFFKGNLDWNPRREEFPRELQ